MLRLIQSLISCYIFIRKSQVKKVLVVDLNYLGDMIMSSPVYKALKDLTGARVDVLAWSMVGEALEANPYIDEKHLLRSQGFLSLFTRALRLRKEKYDLVLQLNTSLKTNFIMWIIGRKYRLGFGYGYNACFNNVRIPIPCRSGRSINKVEENLRLIEQAFGTTIEDKETIFYVEKDPVPNDYIVIHTLPRQTRDRRCWNKFPELAEALRKTYPNKIVFTGSEDDQVEINWYFHEFWSFAGRFNLTGFAELIQGCRLFITVNTGVMHIAGALKVPTVAIIGGTPAKIVCPKYKDFRYLQDPALDNWNPSNIDYVPRINEISVNQVMNEVNKLLCPKN